ncbi:MAG: 2-polyprenyl-6-methoxyphenol hydroxylase [Rhizobiales bacterium]|nr:2-polyprenyl-6-methoxyphenol hydroxylase [Hyphomicrobiales bacterium]
MAASRKRTDVYPSKIPVLIVGGGPVGLALAVELGWRGVACMLLEQGDGKIATPKMNEVSSRTMEFCRRWGMADQVLNCPFPADYPLDAAFVTSMFGYEMGRVERPPRAAQQPEPHSPYRLQACSQIWFDPMLRNLAQSFPHVALRYRHRLERFTVTADGVHVEILNRDAGEQRRITADYLVGCDGATSPLREALGIALEGKDVISNPIHLYFRAPDLVKKAGKKPATFFLPVDGEGLWGNIRVIDPANAMWRLMVDATDGTATPDAIDRERYLRRAMGRPFDVEWLGVSIWKRRSVVAECYGRGRVFLAGDAVHQLSPTGALGMNSGVGDAVDLGWKLAAVLQGWGGGNLLASYDADRRPIGIRNVRAATRFYATNEAFGRGNTALADDSPTGAAQRAKLGERMLQHVGEEFRTTGLQLGYHYENSPICISDGTPPPPDEPATYVPTARPGSRAPHVWLGDGRTTLDLFGRAFVLLCFAGAPDVATIDAAARKRGVPLQTVTVDNAQAAALYQRRLVMVRPDGHVAWRADTVPSDSLALIDRVRGA